MVVAVRAKVLGVRLRHDLAGGVLDDDTPDPTFLGGRLQSGGGINF